MREGLSAAGLPVPPAIAQSAHQIMHTGLRQAAEALRIQQQLEKAGVPALFLKGSTLAVRAYGSIAVRSSMDIDMVVAPGDVPCAWQVLEEAGYVMTAPARALPAGVLRTYQTISKDSVHRNPANGVKIELHWRLSDAAHESALPPPREWRQMEINPTLTLSTLSDPALFAYLSAHGAGHGWARLKWLADIGALLGNSEDGGSALWESARSSGAARPAASAIMLANTLLGTPLPPGFVPPRSVRLRLLNALSLRVIAAGGGARELSHTRWNSVVEPAAMLLTLSSWPDAWAQIRRIAIPAEDIVLLRLPPGFGFLYPLLRLPLWILKRTRWSPRVHVKLPQRAA